MNLSVFCLSLLFGLIYSTANDFQNIRIYASAPLTYTHTTGGGAINDQTVGRTNDVVSSLEGGDFKCNDLVSYLVYVDVFPTVKDANQCIDMTMVFTADSTGQSGVAFGDVPNFVVNRGNVENGANGTPTGPSCVCAGNPGRGVYGRDCYLKANGNEVTSFVSKRFTAPLFTSNDADLQFVIRLCGINAGESIVVRFDVRIFCLPKSSPTGNLQGAFMSTVCTDGTVISGGMQTIPLKNVNRIVGTYDLCTAPTETPLPGPDFNATVQVYGSNQNGGSVTNQIWYSWTQGVYKIQNVANPAIVSLNSFDTACSFLHDGTILYSQSTCGCEATFIPVTQPQLFFNVNSSYYSTTFTVETINGTLVRHYTRISNLSAITDLYVLDASPAIVYKATFVGGEYWIFSNVVLAPQSPSVFTLPAQTTATNCTCKRPLDIEIVLQRDASLKCSSFGNVISFVKLFVAGFVIGPSNTLMGVIYYDTTVVQKLPLLSGTNPANINNAASSIGCVGSLSSPAGSNLNPGGSLTQAIAAALTNLQTSTRGNAQKAILIVGNGFSETTTAVAAAVATANAAGVKVYAVVSESYQVQSDLINMVDKATPANLVYRFFSTDLVTGNILDITSRMCLGASTPCGSFCCGLCDTVCGTCTPVSTCPPSNNCSYSNIISGDCCIQSPQSSCVSPVGTCQQSTCNAVTGLCELVNTCGLGALDTACYSYTCVAGICQKKSKLTSTNCTFQTCVNNAVVNNNVPCSTNTACLTFTCVESKGGCAATPTTNPSPNANNLCYNNTCDPLVGWTSVPKDCSLGNACNPGTCLNGVCTNTPVICNDPNNKCDLSTCSGGACTPRSVVCTPPNACKVLDPVYTTTGGCVPGSGICSFVDVICVPSGLCPNSTQVCVSGACQCKFTFPPTGAPTTAPTRAPTVPTPPPATPTDAPTEAPTSAPTIVPCSNCVNDLCQTTPCDPSVGTCGATVNINCSSLITDTCTQVVGPCAPLAGGCQFGPITCPAPPDACTLVVKDNTFPGCCKTTPKVCGTNGCFNYTCNPATGACSNASACVSNPANLCVQTQCTGTTCATTTVTCTPPDACHTALCNPATGTCDYSLINCNDGNACSVDSCDPVSGCQNVATPCAASVDKCFTTAPCNNISGVCATTAVICNDGKDCTVDTCDPALGCVFTKTDSLCKTNNPCDTNGVCTAASTTDATGCSFTPKVCNGSNFCSNSTCKDYTGCVTTPRDCFGNTSNTSCDTYNCSVANAKCEKISGQCFSFLGAIVGGLVGGVLAAIIVAALLLAGASVAGGVYAVSTAVGNNAAVLVVSNPMYEGSGKHRENPLNQ